LLIAASKKDFHDRVLQKIKSVTLKVAPFHAELAMVEPRVA
jgi:hypothetical protein